MSQERGSTSPSPNWTSRRRWASRSWPSSRGADQGPCPAATPYFTTETCSWSEDPRRAWIDPHSWSPTGRRRFPALHTVIIGAGEVGLNTARMLSHEGHDVVLVEKDGRLVEQATEELDALVIAGNGANPKLLKEAGIKSSDLLVAASNSDEVNIIACLAAKAQGVSRTVARIHNPDYYEPGEPFAREMLGIDFIIHTVQMAAPEIREALLVPGAINVESFAE